MIGIYYDCVIVTLNSHNYKMNLCWVYHLSLENVFFCHYHTETVALHTHAQFLYDIVDITLHH